MNDALKTTIQAAITKLTERATKASGPADDALKFSQAATNLANAFATFSHAASLIFVPIGQDPTQP